MTCIKLQRWLDAKEYASRALSAQPQNIKALFRRGMAEAELNELDLARQGRIKRGLKSRADS